MTTPPKILERIQKLLDVAEATSAHASAHGADSGTLREAERALAEAYRLMARHNLDEAAVRGAAPRSKGDWVSRSVGQFKERPAESRWVNTILTEFFLVRTLEVKIKTSKFTYCREYLLFGLSVNVDIAEFLFHSLSRQMREVWFASKREQHLTEADRSMYLQGLYSGLMERLRKERAGLPDEVGTALVCVSRDLGTAWDRHVGELAMQLRPVRSTVRGAERAYDAGHRDSANIKIEKVIKAPADTRRLG